MWESVPVVGRDRVAKGYEGFPGAFPSFMRIPPRGLANEPMYITKRDNRIKWDKTRISIKEYSLLGGGLDKIGLGKQMRKTLDWNISFQLCLCSLPTLDGWSAWRILETSSSLPWQPCLFMRPSAQAPKVLYVRALPQPMSLYPSHPTYPLLILLTVSFSMGCVLNGVRQSHREKPKKDMLCPQGLHNLAMRHKRYTTCTNLNKSLNFPAVMFPQPENEKTELHDL